MPVGVVRVRIARGAVPSPSLLGRVTFWRVGGDTAFVLVGDELSAVSSRSHRRGGALGGFGSEQCSHLGGVGQVTCLMSPRGTEFRSVTITRLLLLCFPNHFPFGGKA